MRSPLSAGRVGYCSHPTSSVLRRWAVQGKRSANGCVTICEFTEANTMSSTTTTSTFHSHDRSLAPTLSWSLARCYSHTILRRFRFRGHRGSERGQDTSFAVLGGGRGSAKRSSTVLALP